MMNLEMLDLMRMKMFPLLPNLNSKHAWAISAQALGSQRELRVKKRTAQFYCMWDASQVRSYKTLQPSPTVLKLRPEWMPKDLFSRNNRGSHSPITALVTGDQMGRESLPGKMLTLHHSHTWTCSGTEEAASQGRPLVTRALLSHSSRKWERSSCPLQKQEEYSVFTHPL